ncbi:Hypothetical protein SCLAV_3330 [Streptomyces clavuligerus]|uniref:Uncharacterized protein n=1 Tax=Streptomyces clavuligerus TaxID=1901 RepID=E2PZY2_STRCL|nr:Hypothetical protein SCLAV_3330 [Streptomyces clavuligerus]
MTGTTAPAPCRSHWASEHARRPPPRCGRDLRGRGLVPVRVFRSACWNAFIDELTM